MPLYTITALYNCCGNAPIRDKIFKKEADGCHQRLSLWVNGRSVITKSRAATRLCLFARFQSQMCFVLLTSPDVFNVDSLVISQLVNSQFQTHFGKRVAATTAMSPRSLRRDLLRRGFATTKTQKPQKPTMVPSPPRYASPAKVAAPAQVSPIIPCMPWKPRAPSGSLAVLREAPPSRPKRCLPSFWLEDEDDGEDICVAVRCRIAAGGRPFTERATPRSRPSGCCSSEGMFSNDHRGWLPPGMPREMMRNPSPASGEAVYCGWGAPSCDLLGLESSKGAGRREDDGEASLGRGLVGLASVNRSQG